MLKLSDLLARNVSRDIMHLLFLNRGLTKKPSDSLATTSDLFPIRSGKNWSTQFELLNIHGLIRGFSAGHEGKLLLYFFDAEGNILGVQTLTINEFARNSITLPPESENFTRAATFAVFHKPVESVDTAGSLLAERGYTGYEYLEKGLKGYVHGNLDALSLDSCGNLICIGNLGFFQRSYLVQHPFRGPAKYDFYLTNPTNKSVRVQMKVRESLDWKKVSETVIPSRGLRTFSLELNDEELKAVKFVSQLYMCRPIVFRTTKSSMDVFHG